MLVLTRKPNQSIKIGDDVEVSVLSVSGDKVRIGIDAPREVGILRTEIVATVEPSGNGNANGSRNGHADVPPRPGEIASK